MAGLPVRMAVPAGPRPRFTSAQVTLKDLDVAVIEPLLGHGLHAFRFILPGIAHPGHAVAAHLHDDPADFAQQFRLIGGPQHGLMTFGDRLEGPADLAQGLFHPAAVADIPGDAGGADDFPPFIKNRRLDGFHPEDLALLILNRLFHPFPSGRCS